jgi:hypothetical protein
MAECLLGSVFLRGESGIDQLVEIIKVLGTPSREEISMMNPNYMDHKYPRIKPFPFSKVHFQSRAWLIIDFPPISWGGCA